MGRLSYGEIVLGIRPSGIKALVKLAEKQVYRNTIPHSDIVGKKSALVNIEGYVFRRPTLGEYTNLMKRSATPNYPKDIWAILGLLDVGHNGTVLEAGSGSGGLTLHLSKAVGPAGQVFSFEMNSRHMDSAKKNFEKWRHNWALTHGAEWPDNVTFVSEDVRTFAEHVTAAVDYVALDVADPGPLLAHLVPKLQTSTPLSVYLANLTQFVDLLKHIKEKELEVRLERVVEVGHKEWAVREVASKASRLSSAFFSDKYICRPEHYQPPHTGFIGLLRRTQERLFLPLDSTRTVLDDSLQDGNQKRTTNSCGETGAGDYVGLQRCDSQNTETAQDLASSGPHSCCSPNNEAEVVQGHDSTDNKVDTLWAHDKLDSREDALDCGKTETIT